MGFLDWLFGSSPSEVTRDHPRNGVGRGAPSADELALERYRYLVRTAPPETIEQVHAEAFARLSDQQRALIYEELSQGAGTGERPLSSEPATLARAGTRAEMRQAGSWERVLTAATDHGRTPGSPAGSAGFGSMFGASLLGTVAGYVVGSALVSAFLPWDGGAASAAAPEPDGADGGVGDFGGDSLFGDFGF